MKLRAAHATDIGRVRSTNEDSVLCRPHPSAAGGHLMILADGLGGTDAGEVASNIAVHTVAEVYFASGAGGRGALQQALAEANARIYRTARERPDTQAMGTTCTVLALENGQAWVAHVGDSRAYWIHEGMLTRLTQVHSVWAERVAAGGNRASPSNPEGRNMLTRAIGIEPEVTPDVSDPIDVAVGDRFVLCSDGLWGLVTDPEILAIVQANGDEDACQHLIQLANARGGHDNITVVVAEVCP